MLSEVKRWRDGGGGSQVIKGITKGSLDFTLVVGKNYWKRAWESHGQI